MTRTAGRFVAALFVAAAWLTVTASGAHAYTVRCNDGTYSSSGGKQGACSHHGGVASSGGTSSSSGSSGSGTSSGGATAGSASSVCPRGTYVNSAGHTICNPYPSATQPAGATAQCNDGFWSFSETRSGTCSSHGGVRLFFGALAVTGDSAGTTSGDVQGSRIVSSSPGTAVQAASFRPTGTVTAVRPVLAKSGLSHERQLVELGVLFIALGTALVTMSRPGVIK